MGTPTFPRTGQPGQDITSSILHTPTPYDADFSNGPSLHSASLESPPGNKEYFKEQAVKRAHIEMVKGNAHSPQQEGVQAQSSWSTKRSCKSGKGRSLAKAAIHNIHGDQMLGIEDNGRIHYSRIPDHLGMMPFHPWLPNESLRIWIRWDTRRANSLHRLAMCKDFGRPGRMSFISRMAESKNSSANFLLRREQVDGTTGPSLQHGLESERFQGRKQSREILGEDLVMRMETSGRMQGRGELEIDISYTETTDEQNEPAEEATMGWTSLKQLTLFRTRTDHDTESVLSRLFGKCGQIRKIWIKDCFDNCEYLVQAMLTHMPNLNHITMGQNHGDIPEDVFVATILRGSLNGWAVVELWPAVKMRREGMNALANHFTTLETVLINDYNCSSDSPVEILRSCPSLETFGYNEPDLYPDSYPQVDAITFVDYDPDQDSLRPWRCETTLKTLKVVIGGIPRPGEGVIEEEYPGQRREIQGRVFDRLARLIKLEYLRLGGGEYKVGITECLEMSLESGLAKLSGLKKLRELDVTGMEAKIGSNELQWMVENWPSLHCVRGLGEDEFSDVGTGVLFLA
ncbi:MAG: hypothetical protein J3Q66DRAFT_443333 [Benniella sp.]|nr:MAG: hypothetical protein J3Q66DRAFT_443333 [Benniella sp.]